MRGLAARGRYRELKRRLADEDLNSLTAAWPELEPMERVVIFKLLTPSRAMNIFAALPFEERFFMFEAFPLESIAPVLEGLPVRERMLFHRLPKRRYEEMLASLSAEATA